MAVTYYTDSQGIKRPLPVPVHHHDLSYASADHSHSFEDTGWAALTFQNDWFNYSASWAQGEYRRLRGVVYLKGLIRRTASVPPSTGDVLAVLPPGFRPAETNLFSVADQYAIASGVWNHAQRIDILSDGTIRPQYINDRDGDCWVSLSNIRYPAEA